MNNDLSTRKGDKSFFVCFLFVLTRDGVVVRIGCEGYRVVRSGERIIYDPLRPLAFLFPVVGFSPMFLGEYQHTMDDKGRLAIPTKFRAALLRGAVVTRGLDRALVVYAAKEWKALATKLAALPISQQNSRAFARLMLAGAMDVSVDPQGRLAIPEYLLCRIGPC